MLPEFLRVLLDRQAVAHPGVRSSIFEVACLLQYLHKPSHELSIL
jgi:hypothetical protein